MMLLSDLVNSHSQVSDPGPSSPLVIFVMSHYCIFSDFVVKKTVEALIMSNEPVNPSFVSNSSFKNAEGLFSRTLGDVILHSVFGFSHSAACMTSSDCTKCDRNGHEQIQQTGNLDFIGENQLPVLQNTSLVVPAVRRFTKEKEWSFFVGWWSD